MTLPATVLPMDQASFGKQPKMTADSRARDVATCSQIDHPEWPRDELLQQVATNRVSDRLKSIHS